MPVVENSSARQTLDNRQCGEQLLDQAGRGKRTIDGSVSVAEIGVGFQFGIKGDCLLKLDVGIVIALKM